MTGVLAAFGLSGPGRIDAKRTHVIAAQACYCAAGA